MSKKQRVLVTGGAGFIGTALASLLAPSAERWVVVDSMHPQVHASPDRPVALHPSAEFIVADVTDESWWLEVIQDVRPDVVVHLAAETGTAQSLDEASRHANVNVLGTTRLIDSLSAVGHFPSRIVLSSSRAVYGEGRWVDEAGQQLYPGQRSHAQLESGQWDFPGLRSLPSDSVSTFPNPTSVYGATKLAQENILSAWGSSHGVPVSVLRLQNVYGPGQSLSNPYTGIVSLFSQLAKGGDQIPLYEDGLITRDFVYIDDVAAALAEVIVREHPYEGPAIDIGSGVGTTIAQLAGVIADLHGAPRPEVNGRYRDGDVRHAHVDISRSLEVLDWSPKWNVSDGIAALQVWIDEQKSIVGAK